MCKIFKGVNKAQRSPLGPIPQIDRNATHHLGPKWTSPLCPPPSLASGLSAGPAPGKDAFHTCRPASSSPHSRLSWLALDQLASLVPALFLSGVEAERLGLARRHLLSYIEVFRYGLWVLSRIAFGSALWFTCDFGRAPLSCRTTVSQDGPT